MSKKQFAYPLLIIIAVLIFAALFICFAFIQNNNSTTLTAYDTGSALSSAGERVAFAKQGQNIYSIGLDGTSLRELTSSGHIWDPCLSLDGNRICFVRRPINKEYDYNELVVMNIDGTSEKIIFPREEGVLNLYPSFSPDGQRIVFLHHFCDRRSKNSSVCEIKMDGSNLQDYGIDLSNPRYSTDGKVIYGFTLDKPVCPSATLISAIDTHTKKNRIISRIPLEAYEVNYSPDCKHIVFAGLDKIDRKGFAGYSGYQYQIYSAEFSGKDIRKLTHNPGPKHNPIFSSDGSQIIFLHQEQKMCITRMNTNGTNFQKIYEW